MFYRLEELDGTQLAASFAGNRLKKFFSRETLDEDRAPLHNTIRVRDVLEEGDDGADRDRRNARENLGDIEKEEEQDVAVEDGRD